MEAPRSPAKQRVPVSIRRLLPQLARVAAGAIAGAILGKAASAAVGYVLYIAMVLSVLNRPVGLDSWFMAMAALPLLGWSFGALPGALSGGATLASRKPIAALTGSLASLAYALSEVNRGNPDLGGFIAVITSLGATIAGASLYLGNWLFTPGTTRGRKAA